MTPNKIIIERDGINHVKILKPILADEFELVWAFSLEGDDNPIVLKTFFTNELCVIVNWDGWVRIVDISKREICLSEKLSMSIDAKAALSPDKTKLYVIGRTDKGETLFTYSLNNFTRSIPQQLPKNSYNNYLDIRTDGNLLLYYNEGERTAEGKAYKHGFNVLDVKNMQITNHPLPHPQCDMFEVKEPVVIPKINRGFIPLWDKVTVKKNKEGEDVFEFKLLVFTLDTIEIVQKVTVREFEEAQLAYYEGYCSSMAEAFTSGIQDKEYEKALTNFTQELNSIVFNSLENCIWLCWRGGIIRRMDLNDGSLSPILATESYPDSTSKGVFKFPTFHSKIAEVHEGYLLIKEHSTYYRLSLAGLDLKSDVEVLPVNLQRYNMSIISSEEAKVAENLRNKILIEVGDLNSKKGFHEGLDEMILLIKNIDTIRKGEILAFAIKDKKGKIMFDGTFFREAAKDTKTLDKIATLVQLFATYPKAGELYIDCEETALCYANLVLAQISSEYLHINFQYLSVIDVDHDVFNREVLIPFLMEKYQDTSQMKIIYEQLSAISELWIEGYEIED